jgi:hypothetical protein
MSPAILFSFGDLPRAAERLILSDYVWGADQYGASYETPSPGKSLYSPGLGSLTNSHPAYANVFKLASAVPLLDRRFDPGAGAFTDYVSSYVFTTIGDNHLLADENECLAEELVINYGDAWFDERRDFRDLPRRDDYAQADQVVASFALVHAKSVDAVTAGTVDDLLQFSADMAVNQNAARILHGISSRDDLIHVLKSNGTARASAGQRRGREWLERHGHCQDRLYLATSTIPQAGRGAFARRAVREDDVILSSPLLPIFDWQQQLRDTHAPHSGQESLRPAHGLLLNYVFGHANSSAAFLPSTLLLVVNHASIRSGGNSSLEPNARLSWATWSKKSTYHTRRPLDDLRHERSTTVVLDLVALRDLQADEEILIDYGEEWEDHWDMHVRAWKPPCKTDPESCLKSSKVIWEMNGAKFNPVFHRWSDDHFTVCSLVSEDGQYVEEVSTLPHGVPSNEIPNLEVSPNDGGFDLAQMHFRSAVPCQIIGFDELLRTFDVLLFSTEENAHGVLRVLRRHRHFPSERLQFRSKPYR